MKILIIILLPFLVILACQSSKQMTKENGNQKIDFVDIKEAESFNVARSGTSVIRTEAEWQEWWNAYWNLFSGSREKTPPPAVNFDEEMVIAVHWGEGYSGCSNKVNAIDSIVKTSDSIEVVVSELPDLGPCDMIVHPIQMVRVPKVDLPVRFSGGGARPLIP